MARLDSKIFPALTEDIVARLQSKSIFTVYDFMLQTCDELMAKTGLSFKETEGIKEAIFKNFGGKIANPASVYERELEAAIPTGIKNLDDLLNGGLHCRKIYEFCGSSSSGKSQLCHWISMYSTLNASTEVHYVDTSKNFCASRIQMMLETKQCNDNIIGKVMSGIRVHRVQHFHEMFTVLHHLSNNSADSESLKRLVIVDSLSALCAIVSNAELNSILSNLASVCRYLVDHLRAVLVIVNTVRLDRAGIAAGANLRPSLGHYWLGVPNVRLLMTLLEDARREIAVWKSSQLENGKKCFVSIKDEGILSS